MLADHMKSLNVGDVLYMPMQHLGKTLKSVVLYIDDKGFYPSWPQEELFVSCPLVFSPYRWSSEDNAIVDRDGDIPRWYSEHIRVERGANIETPAEYARIPRRKDVKIDVLNAELKEFYSQRDKKRLDKILMMNFVLRNQVYARESGSDANAAELLLEIAGIKEYDNDALCLLAMLVNELRDAQKKESHMFVFIPLEGVEDDGSIMPVRKPMATRKGPLH